MKTHFDFRLATNLTLIKEAFFRIYPESEVALNDLLVLLNQLFDKRPLHLKKQDLVRINTENWYRSEKLVGMQLYVDLFSKDLKGLQKKIPYLEDLGINFLHIMPITTRPEGENDGGYAVNSHTTIDPKYGTPKDLESLTAKLRSKNMFLMLDFVVNHTSDEHEWAVKAKAGEEKYQQYYYTYNDRTVPDEFEKSLPEVFPKTAPGNYTFIPEMNRWVMTVFNTYQWDLNYTNPTVFLEMLTNLVELSNLGVDVVRFDALAFLWKKMGTISQNLDEAHTIVFLFRMCLQVVAPSTILLAEAIVAPRDILKYFGEGIRTGNECEIAYNASLMALLWNSIATKKTALLYKTLINAPTKPNPCTWINYIRCHDDIGLGLDDQYIQELGWNPQGHRKFLLDYYCQRTDWSPAKGLLFMYNPKTGDGRITGSAASLLGLEKALEDKNEELLKQSRDKIVMLHGLILSFGGIPLIYAGDEIGALNDYSFLEDEYKRQDNRWVNRPQQDWELITSFSKKDSIHSQIFTIIKKLIRIRKSNSVFADNGNTLLHHTANEHVLIYERRSDKDEGIMVLCNFDEHPQVVETSWIGALGYLKDQEFHNLITGDTTALKSGFLELRPYQLLWLRKWH